MGAAASKTGAKQAAAVATRKTAGAASEGAPHVIRTNLTREDLVAMASRPTRMERPGEAVGKMELVEMKEELLHRVERFEDFGRVEYLAELSKEFERTASSHRARSTAPVSMPRDRTAAVSTGGVVVEEDMPGRITNVQLRTLLRLHYEEPLEWTPEVLARKYALDERAVRNVLRAVGPANVLPPAGPSEHPLGVWHPQTPSQLAE